MGACKVILQQYTSLEFHSKLSLGYHDYYSIYRAERIIRQSPNHLSSLGGVESGNKTRKLEILFFSGKPLEPIYKFDL